MESYPTQAVLPLVGLAAEKAIRDRYNAPKESAQFSPTFYRPWANGQWKRTHAV
ncbi:MAG: hypothetical protein ACQESR_20385 [Planctomycetota bacterium]